MAQKGYNSYRGRRFGGRLFPVLVLVLVLLAACAFMLAQEHIIYSDDGSIRLDLPFLREKDTPEEPGDMNLIIEGEEQPEETPEPTPVPTPEDTSTTEPTPTPDPTPEDTSTTEPTPTPEPTPEDTSTTEPTPTPVPSDDPIGEPIG